VAQEIISPRVAKISATAVEVIRRGGKYLFGEGHFEAREFHRWEPTEKAALEPVLKARSLRSGLRIAEEERMSQPQESQR